jgi:hypothetical protein
VHPSRASRISNAGLKVIPPHQPSTVAPLPPDIASSRKERINNDLLTFFKRTAAIRPSSSHSTANPPYLRGIGLYTHAEIPPPPIESLFPHQRFVQPVPETKFIPLGGPGRRARKDAFQPELPDDVKALYGKLKDVVTREERDTSKPYQTDLRQKYGVLGLPDIMVPSPPSMPPPTPSAPTSPGEGSDEMDIDRSSPEVHEERRNYGSANADPARRPSWGGGMKSPGVSGSRPQTPTDRPKTPTGRPKTPIDTATSGPQRSVSKSAPLGSSAGQKLAAWVAMKKKEANAAKIAARIQASAPAKTGSAPTAPMGVNRPRTPTDVAIGGTKASAPRPAAQPPASTAKSTSATTAGTAAGTIASGTIYDASRDPRRRGR